MKSLAVFCGSSLGRNPVFRNTAKELGARIAEKGITLVYGGGNVGLMGILSTEVMARGGEVIGIIPGSLSKEVPHIEISRLITVRNMHERKAGMYELSDAFCVLPGGIGTMDEFFEIFTWYQLNLHEKPIALLNTENYFNKLLSFLEHSVKEGFVKQGYIDSLVVSDSIDGLFSSLERFKPLSLKKW